MTETQKRRLRPIVATIVLLLAVPAIAQASAELSSDAPRAAAPARSSATVASPMAELAETLTPSDPEVEQTLREELTLQRHRQHLREVAREKHLRWVKKQRHIKWVKEQRAKKAAAARAAAEAAAARAAEAAAAAEAAQEQAQQQASTPPPAPSSSGADWYAIAQCESGGNWSINTGNGFWGGLQFTPSTWFGYGGGPFSGSGPFPYSAAAQIAVAERVLAGQGPDAWPNCFQWK
jgi:hypothetical protein